MVHKVPFLSVTGAAVDALHKRGKIPDIVVFVFCSGKTVNDLNNLKQTYNLTHKY